jgi:hypothetical protein
MIDIEAEITKLQIGPTDFVVITTPGMLTQQALEGLVWELKQQAPRTGVPLERILVSKGGMTITVADAGAGRKLIAGARAE